MSVLSWLRGLFRHTADRPPPVDPLHPPAGLERPDEAEMVGEVVALAPVPETPLPGPAEFTVAVQRAPEPPPTKRPASESSFGESFGEDVYGLTFSIEYEAASGAVTRRRIMLRSISERDGDVYLRAMCFERSAPRTFRLDRVLCVIDGDGVVHDDPVVFFRDQISVVLPASPVPSSGSATATPPDPELARLAPAVVEEPPGQLQRRLARDGLRVLVALARSDGLLHADEVDAVLDYVEAVCAGQGAPCAAADRTALAGYVRRQRPGSDVLEECLFRLDAAGMEAQRLLLIHAERVIQADGMEHPAEVAALGQMRTALGKL